MIFTNPTVGLIGQRIYRTSRKPSHVHGNDLCLDEERDVRLNAPDDDAQDTIPIDSGRPRGFSSLNSHWSGQSNQLPIQAVRPRVSVRPREDEVGT